MFPIELLRIAGVSPFQNPFKPCSFKTMFEYPLNLSNMVPFIRGDNMIVILKISKGWKIVETNTPENKPIPLCTMVFLDVECLTLEGIFFNIIIQHLKILMLI